MGAPEKNQFWKKRTKHGRDKIFSDPKELLSACYDYFDYQSKQAWLKQEPIKGGEFAGQLVPVPTASPFSIKGLCIYLGVNSKYLNEFESNLKPDESKIDKDFSEIITHVKDVIYVQKSEGAIVGAYKDNIIARELGLTDKKELSGPDGGAIETKLIITMVDSGPKPASSEKEIELE